MDTIQFLLKLIALKLLALDVGIKMQMNIINYFGERYRRMCVSIKGRSLSCGIGFYFILILCSLQNIQFHSYLAFTTLNWQESLRKREIMIMKSIILNLDLDDIENSKYGSAKNMKASLPFLSAGTYSVRKFCQDRKRLNGIPAELAKKFRNHWPTCSDSEATRKAAHALVVAYQNPKSDWEKCFWPLQAQLGNRTKWMSRSSRRTSQKVLPPLSIYWELYSTVSIKRFWIWENWDKKLVITCLGSCWTSQLPHFARFWRIHPSGPVSQVKSRI